MFFSRHCEKGDLLEQRVLWETEGAVRDSVHVVQLDLLDLLTAEQDEVVLEDQKIVVCDDNEALLFVVPVINPENSHTGKYHNNEGSSKMFNTWKV